MILNYINQQSFELDDKTSQISECKLFRYIFFFQIIENNRFLALYPIRKIRLLSTIFRHSAENRRLLDAQIESHNIEKLYPMKIGTFFYLFI